MLLNRRLVFIRKQWTGKTGWSDAIGQFFERVAPKYQEAQLFEVRVAGLKALAQQNRELVQMCRAQRTEQLDIFVHHSISWWALAPALLLLRRAGARVVLHMHEHEHILGLGFCVRHFGRMRVKEWLRYSRLYHRIPAHLSSEVVVLSEPQAFCIGRIDARRENFLSINGTVFRPDSVQQPVDTVRALRVLFPHDPVRFDKGHRFLEALKPQLTGDYEIIMGRSLDLPYQEVYKKYWMADCIFLPSDWESFSLVAIEALACNKYIIASRYIGSLRSITHKYTIEELEKFGVFISEHHPQKYLEAFLKAKQLFDDKITPRSRELFAEFFEKYTTEI